MKKNMSSDKSGTHMHNENTRRRGENKKEAERIFKEIMTENLPNLMKNIHIVI